MAVSQAKEARPLVELPQVRPNHLRSFFDGRREIVVSLHTRDEGQARARVLAIALETEKAFQRAREQFHALVVDPDAMAKEWKPKSSGTELSSRDPKGAARLTDVVGDLLIVLDPPQPRLRLSQLLLLARCLSHDCPRRLRLEGTQGKVNR